MPDSTYNSYLERMFRLQRFGIKLGLETIGAMLAALGHPENRLRCIHIAGTNGKGSVAAMLSRILTTAGYTVGRYTSPHLERFNERICINEQPVDDAQVVEACRRVFAIDDLPRQPTFFEFTTAMALDQFARQKVQWAVIETGMGGRLDATNILQPALSVITNISLEHRSYLGHTLAAIAAEKAGIIKQNTPVVSGVRQKAAKAVIHAHAATRNAPLFQLGRDFRVRRREGDPFDYHGLDHTWRKLLLGLPGAHQLQNAPLALAACELLQRTGMVAINEADVRSGLRETRWPGRLEVVCTAPHIVLDGAHNLMAARVLGRYLRETFKQRDITLVVGILDDKPYRSILKDLMAPCHRTIITQPKINRAMPADRLAETARTLGANVEIVPDVGDALRHAVRTSRPTDVICVAGSLYVVGEAKTALADIPLF